MKQNTLIGFMVILLLALSACQTTSEHAPVPMMPVAEKMPAPVDMHTAPMMAGSHVKEFNVEAFQFSYEPSEIRVQEGDTVVIHLTSRDVPHSFTLKEFGFVVDAEKGKVSTDQFIANKKGTFHWYCNIPCGSGHKKMGGTLVVE